MIEITYGLGSETAKGRIEGKKLKAVEKAQMSALFRLTLAYDRLLTC